MMFIYADALDYVDPNYDFSTDRMGQNRKAYWDDLYAHELLDDAPYDGILVSRGIVGDHRVPGKYSESQSMRFRRVGARTFLRFGGKYERKPIFGDCGAFSYHRMKTPPYTAEDMLEFYEDGRFTHGCSVDHVIFDFDRSLSGMAGGTEDARSRFDITLQNAEEFIKISHGLGPSFTPLGVVQGWSPGSMAESARRLVAMGYSYLAVGGMVPLSAKSIHSCLRSVAEKIGHHSGVRLHLLGFAKADQIKEFSSYPIASFDSTSPLLRAFKDNRRNFYLPNESGGLDYYSALRIPQATENATLRRRVKEGRYRQEELIAMESKVLESIRAFDKGKCSSEVTLESLLAYSRPLISDPKISEVACNNRLKKLEAEYVRTLADMPWKRCDCRVCRSSGVEVAIFRGSNRNKRRGMHNLYVYHNYLKNETGFVRYEH